MDEAPQRYPLLRGRRRRRRRWAPRRLAWPRPGRRSLRWLAAALLAAALAAGVWWVRRPTPSSAPAELAQARALLAAGNYSAARLHADAAVRARPGWGEAHAALARIHLAMGRGDAAEGELSRAAATGFDPGAIHPLRAEALLLQGDADGALDEAAAAPSRVAAAAARVRARALAAGGDVPAAQGVLVGVLARNPRDARAWRDLAQVRFDAGDVAGAEEAVGHALADRGDLDALVLKGELVRSRYGLAAALAWFDAALKRDAFFHRALVARAETLGEMGRARAMLADTRAALAARPDSAEALYLQAVLAARAGRDALATALLARTGGALDRQPATLLLAGVLDYRAGRIERAVASWREWQGRQPTSILARRLLGAALLRSGDPRGALDVLRPVALRADADRYTLALVGRAFEATGERDWAGRFLDRAARAPAADAGAFAPDDGVAALADGAADAPTDPRQLVFLVRGLLTGGEGAAAVARAQALAAASPGAAQAQALLGDALAATGRWNEAAAAYARAADLRFDLPAMLKLTEALERSGRHPAAARALALYLAQNPASDAGTRLRARAELATGDMVAAAASFAVLRRGAGPDASLLAGLAAARAADDPAAALRYARAAYRLQPMDRATVAAYAQALAATGDPAGAAQLAIKLRALP
jgi:cellulose synthase operon protein C